MNRVKLVLVAQRVVLHSILILLVLCCLCSPTSGQLLHSHLQVQTAHVGPVRSIAFNKSKSILASAGSDHLIILWDVATNKVLRTLFDHQKPVNSIRFDSTGRILISGSDDGTVRLWDLGTGKSRSLDLGAPVTSIAASNRSNMIVVGCADFAVYRVTWTETKFDLPKRLGYLADHEIELDGNLSCIALSSDEEYVAVGGWDESGWAMSLFNTKSGQNQDLRADDSSDSGFDRIESLAFKPGSHVLASGGDHGDVVFWNVNSRTRLRANPVSEGSVTSLTFDENGTHLLTGSGDKENSIKYWAVDNEKLHLLTTYEPHKDVVSDLAFGPAGSFVSASFDTTVRIWNLKGAKPVHILAATQNRPDKIAISPDGTRMAVASGDAVSLWNLKSGDAPQNLHPAVGRILGLSFCDRTHLVCNSISKVITWDIEKNQISHLFDFTDRFHQNTNTNANDKISAAEISSDGKVVAVGTEEGWVLAWNVDSGALLGASPLPKLVDEDGKDVVLRVSTLAISPNNRMLAVGAGGSLDGGLFLFDLSDLTGKAPWTLWNYYVEPQSGNQWSKATALAFDDQSSRLAVGQVDYVPEGSSPHAGYLSSVNIEIWDVNRKKSIAEMKDSVPPGKLLGYGAVTSLQFSKDGHFLASGSIDATAHIWDCETKRPLIATQQPSSISSVAYLAKDTQLVCASMDGTVGIWDTARKPVPSPQDSMRLIVNLVALGENAWVVQDDAGRFDASDGDVEGLHWVVRNIPIELNQFKKDYYDPGLLGKVLRYSTELPRNVVSLSKLEVNLPPIATVDRKNGVIGVTLTDQGGGIGPTDVFVNDQRIYVQPAPRNPGHTYYFSLQRVMPDVHARLVPGEHNGLRVVGHTYDRKLRPESPDYLASRGVELLLEAPKYAAAPPRIFLLAAGISKYRGSRLTLRFAAKDAIDFSREVEAAAIGWVGAERVTTRLLGSDAEHPELKLASRANLLVALDEIAGKAKSTDIFLLYLSGHGVGAGSGEKDYYYVTSDADDATPGTGIFQKVTLSGKEIQEHLLKIHAGKKAVILDTCASGEFGKREGGGDIRRSWEDMKDKTGSYVLAGCAADAVSYEASRYNQGLLTYCLLEAMKANDGVWVADPKSGGTFLDIQKWLSTAEAAVPKLVQAAQIAGVQKPEFRGAKDARDFWVGRLSKQQRERIQLAMPLPVLLPTQNVRDERSASDEDTLNLRGKLNDLLLLKSARGRGDGFALWKTDAQPDAYRFNVKYRVGSSVEATIYLQHFLSDTKAETVATFPVTASIEGLPEAIITEVVRQVGAIKSKSTQGTAP